MGYATWWDYFDEDPYERVGRYVPGTFGEPVIAAIPRISWAYLDWVVETFGYELDEWWREVHADWRPSDGTQDDWREWMVRHEYLHRARHGLAHPPWCPDPHPIEYMDITD
ncbi:MAG: hypothetical protein V2I43_05415 [Parvularcula sp.]|jgi:hypothetical protein|nr:hypothetical protein [Parvularcula sp.]